MWTFLNEKGPKWTKKEQKWTKKWTENGPNMDRKGTEKGTKNNSVHVVYEWFPEGLLTNLEYLLPRESFQPPIAIVTLIPYLLRAVTFL